MEECSNNMERLLTISLSHHQRDGSFDGVSVYYADKQCYTHRQKKQNFYTFSLLLRKKAVIILELNH